MDAEVSNVKLFLSVPSNRHWVGKFGASLAELISYLSADGIKTPGYKLETMFLRALGQASNLSMTRQSFVDEIIKGGYTHWLSLDDDMSFPPDIVDRLIAHGKDVVSVNARLKCNEVAGSLVGLDGVRLNSVGRTGLQEIRSMGGAIFLARTEAFKDIPKPHFQVLWSAAHQEYISEDVYFATLLRTKGVKLYCDHSSSQFISHIGDFEYKWDYFKQSLRIVA